MKIKLTMFGITPDIEVENSEEDLAKNVDKQLDKAIEEIKNK